MKALQAGLNSSSSHTWPTGLSFLTSDREQSFTFERVCRHTHTQTHKQCCLTHPSTSVRLARRMQCSHRTLETGSGMRTCLETSASRLLNCSNSLRDGGERTEIKAVQEVEAWPLWLHWLDISPRRPRGSLNLKSSFFFFSPNSGKLRPSTRSRRAAATCGNFHPSLEAFPSKPNSQSSD